jgi:hypothetical protein
MHMNVLIENEGKIYGALVIDRPSDFENPFPGTLFPCMIWDHNGRFRNAQRAAVANALLQAGCRYAVCGGQDCDAWHIAVDMEFVQQHAGDPDEVREAVHVMTTSHPEENPDDVAFFFVMNTNFDNHDFTRYLVLHVGDSRVKEEVDAAVRRYAINKEAV